MTGAHACPPSLKAAVGSRACRVLDGLSAVARRGQGCYVTFRVSERVVRGMTAATGAALFLSLFLTWSATGLNRRGF